MSLALNNLILGTISEVHTHTHYFQFKVLHNIWFWSQTLLKNLVHNSKGLGTAKDFPHIFRHILGYDFTIGHQNFSKWAISRSLAYNKLQIVWKWHRINLKWIQNEFIIKGKIQKAIFSLIRKRQKVWTSKYKEVKCNSVRDLIV